MATPTLDDLRPGGARLGAGVSAGFLAGLLIGGVGGRLAMLVLRITSDPVLRGAQTDDGFTIGRVSSETLFLLGVAAALGIAGGVLYVVVRPWIPSRWRIPAMAVFFALVGGAGIIRPGGVDFRALSPLALAIALFVAIPAAYGAAVPWLAERLLREGSVLRRNRRAWLWGLLPLILLNVVSVLVLAVALGLWALGRKAPSLVVAWRSGGTMLLGRLALVAAAVVSGIGLVRDGLEILG